MKCQRVIKNIQLNMTALLNNEDDVIVNLCFYRIQVPTDDWIDWLSIESITRGASLDSDIQGNKILALPITRSDLPSQIEEYALVTAVGLSNELIKDKVRWLEIIEPMAIGMVQFIDNKEQLEDSIKLNEKGYVNVMALNSHLFTQSDCQTYNDSYKVHAMLYNKETYEGIQNIFLYLAQQLTVKETELQAQTQITHRNKILRSYNNLSVICVVFNAMVYFVMLNWIKEDFSDIELIAILIGSGLCVAIQYSLQFLVLYIAMGGSRRVKQFKFEDQNYLILRNRYQISIYLFSICSLVFDLAFLVKALIDKDENILNSYIILGCFLLPMLAYWLYYYCRQKKVLKKIEEDARRERLMKRVFKPKQQIDFQEQLIELESDEAENINKSISTM
ncbi:hypothetical protein FGO68_gene1927 [Halteria grandinella]|uniref:Uncharacterized protein n=1 Tax=Halteria grandinella TaxID=5974 RepID=A0A8J8NNZ1_HALGN|nr:hypothetical protein FGO68_gene1927 [Halteria grandinella]